MIRDVWSRLDELDSQTLARLANVLETRGNDANQQEMRSQFLDAVNVPDGATILEVGCGTGILTERIACAWATSPLIAVDSAPSFLDTARRRLLGASTVQFLRADARHLPIRDETIEVVVIDSCLAHVPGPEAAVHEAMRVLRPGGRLAVFEGDYASATVAVNDFDPLQEVMDAAMALTATDRWIVRNLPGLVQKWGGVVQSTTIHPYVDDSPHGYMMSLVDRGTNSLVAEGILLEQEAAELRRMARERSRSGRFFGMVNYASLVFRKQE